MFEWVNSLVSDSPLTYLVIVPAIAVDGFFPLLPGETVVITGGILAANGSLSIALIVLTAMVGAMLGDNFSYFLGAVPGERAAKRLFKGEKGRKRLAWARSMIEKRTWLIIIARFIPGGRTATTFAAGLLGVNWTRFLAYDAVAAALWALYASMLGYLGGEAFKQSLWKPLAVAAGIGLMVAAAGEAYRRLEGRRRYGH